MRFLALLLVASLAACTTGASRLSAPSPSRGGSTLTAQELDATRYPTLMEAISVARPTLLRAAPGSQALLVEVDGAMMADGIGALNTIRTSDVASVTRVSDGTVVHGGVVLRVRLR